MSNPQPVQSSSAWLPANPANPFNSQKPINGLTNSSSSVSGRTTTPTTTPHNGGNSQQTTLAQQRQQLRQLLQSHHATQSNTNQVAGAATGYPRAHVTDIGDTNASTRFATSISPGSAQPGYGSGPVLATDIDDASYIEEQLFNHPNYLADLARLGMSFLLSFFGLLASSALSLLLLSFLASLPYPLFLPPTSSLIAFHY